MKIHRKILCLRRDIVRYQSAIPAVFSFRSVPWLATVVFNDRPNGTWLYDDFSVGSERGNAAVKFRGRNEIRAKRQMWLFVTLEKGLCRLHSHFLCKKAATDNTATAILKWLAISYFTDFLIILLSQVWGLSLGLSPPGVVGMPTLYSQVSHLPSLLASAWAALLFSMITPQAATRLLMWFPSCFYFEDSNSILFRIFCTCEDS